MKFSFSVFVFFLCYIGISSTSIHIIKAPYIVQVERNNKFLCAGIIVNAKWLVTTATCVQESLKLKDLHVRSGAGLMTKGGGLHAVRQIHVHPGFSPKDDRRKHDIALIQLWYHFALSCTVYPMRYPNSPTHAGQEAYYSTWNKTTTPGTKLSMEQSSVIDKESCIKVYKGLHEGTACIKLADQSCIEEGDPVLIAGMIQGFSQDNQCSKNSPVVITDLYNYVDWIEEIKRKFTIKNKGEKIPSTRGACKLNLNKFLL